MRLRFWSLRGQLGRRLLFSSALLASGVLMSSCGLTSVVTGTIRGQLLLSGGPPPVQKRPTNGNVEATGSGRNTYATTVSQNGQFVLHLPAGTYSLTGSSPNYDGGKGECFGSKKFTVSQRQTTRAFVYCLEK
jgi:hypothetical protein